MKKAIILGSVFSVLALMLVSCASEPEATTTTTRQTTVTTPVAPQPRQTTTTTTHHGWRLLIGGNQAARSRAGRLCSHGPVGRSLGYESGAWRVQSAHAVASHGAGGYKYLAKALYDFSAGASAVWASSSAWLTTGAIA